MSTRVLFLAIVIWNVIDLALHAAVNMLEPLRVSGNVVMILTAIAGLALPVVQVFGLAAAFAIYAALNTGWILRNGSLPVPALVFMTVTLVLTVLAVRQSLKARPIPWMNL